MKELSKESERSLYGGDMIKFPSSKLMALGGVSNAISSSDNHLSWMEMKFEEAMSRGRLRSATAYYENIIRIIKTRLIKEHCEL